MICQCNVRVRVSSSCGGGGREGPVERAEIKPRGWMESNPAFFRFRFRFPFSFQLMRALSPRDCKLRLGRRNYVAVSGDAATVVSSLKVGVVVLSTNLT